MPTSRRPHDRTRADAGPAEDVVLLERQVELINRFPDQNPNPVMRVSDDGVLLYANVSSRPILDAIGAAVGAPFPADLFAQLAASASSAEHDPVEVGCDRRTFSVLAVAVPEFGFTNLYGTDITASKVFARFPDRNPNPVFRVTPDGRLSYANAASEPIIRALGVRIGESVPAEALATILAAASGRGPASFEIEGDGRTFAIFPVPVPEFEVINVYATDITAARAVEIAHRENERLLLNILPEAIARRLRAGERVIADRLDEVTLLFADIVDFTSMSSRMNATDVVGLLNHVFSRFDALVDTYELEKIKTIGDSYMVVGGLPGQPGDHLGRTAEMAVELVAAVGKLGFEPPLRFRVGMHVGPVVAGVIGVKKFIYDVWGDTVNTASRMESHGIPGRIHVTQAVFDGLGDRFRFESRGLIDVRGKGLMPTYLLAARAAGAAEAAPGDRARPPLGGSQST